MAATVIYADSEETGGDLYYDDQCEIPVMGDDLEDLLVKGCIIQHVNDGNINLSVPLGIVFSMDPETGELVPGFTYLSGTGVFEAFGGRSND